MVKFSKICNWGTPYYSVPKSARFDVACILYIFITVKAEVSNSRAKDPSVLVHLQNLENTGGLFAKESQTNSLFTRCLKVWLVITDWEDFECHTLKL